MKRTRLREFLATVNKYGGIPLAVLIIVALGVLVSAVPVGPPAEPIPDEEQKVEHPGDGHPPARVGASNEPRGHNGE